MILLLLVILYWSHPTRSSATNVTPSHDASYSVIPQRKTLSMGSMIRGSTFKIAHQVNTFRSKWQRATRTDHLPVHTPSPHCSRTGTILVTQYFPHAHISLTNTTLSHRDTPSHLLDVTTLNAVLAPGRVWRGRAASTNTIAPYFILLLLILSLSRSPYPNLHLPYLPFTSSLNDEWKNNRINAYKSWWLVLYQVEEHTVLVTTFKIFRCAEALTMAEAFPVW